MYTYNNINLPKYFLKVKFFLEISQDSNTHLIFIIHYFHEQKGISK
ncbi:hypothetical protein NBRC111894_1528 [Sporolactobacillus inulinus]|uniref:Uncharacterized protein n=1 Tax=Sporolactobacillus inulinus TaxID=2078 RepID=A0A4Y1ZAC7_9BACL|nr:hypothetical protein NBRC111894_1528 [Sporolactobacillus inulinus]